MLLEKFMTMFEQQGAIEEVALGDIQMEIPGSSLGGVMLGVVNHFQTSSCHYSCDVLVYQ